MARGSACSYFHNLKRFNESAKLSCTHFRFTPKRLSIFRSTQLPYEPPAGVGDLVTGLTSGDLGWPSGGAQRRGAAPTEQLDPCKERRGVVAHKDYCDRYLECSNDQVFEVDCPNGLVFAERGTPLLDNCGYPNQNPYACLDKELASEYGDAELSV